LDNLRKSRLTIGSTVVVLAGVTILNLTSGSAAARFNFEIDGVIVQTNACHGGSHCENHGQNDATVFLRSVSGGGINKVRISQHIDQANLCGSERTSCGNGGTNVAAVTLGASK
jgi:hypothetical protein